MGIDEIYSKAKRIKPDFDYAVQELSKRYVAEAITTPLKNKARAQDKADAMYGGDINEVDDILRASIVVATSDKVTDVFNAISMEFNVVRSANKYIEKQNSSDGYFDARLYVKLDGLISEIQIHTQAMHEARERAHDLYEERQRMLRSGQPLNSEQRVRIRDINKKMRDIFREASQ